MARGSSSGTSGHCTRGQHILVLNSPLPQAAAAGHYRNNYFMLQVLIWLSFTLNVCYVNVGIQDQVTVLLLRQFPTFNHLKQVCIYDCGDLFCCLISFIQYHFLFTGNAEIDRSAGSNQVAFETKISEDEKCCERSRCGPFKHQTSCSVIQKGKSLAHSVFQR